jgi:excisionase family DNA binding protein
LNTNLTDRDLNRLLTPREAARVLAVSERTLWGLTRSGQIPCVRIGRSVRYDPADLRRWIESRKGVQQPAS